VRRRPCGGINPAEAKRSFWFANAANESKEEVRRGKKTKEGGEASDSDNESPGRKWRVKARGWQAGAVTSEGSMMPGVFPEIMR